MNKDFYNPEVRSGYFVSKEIKKLWAVQLDLLRHLDDFCNAYGLKYFAQGGTLLGAVRHKGFIPWDDDVDVVMLWDDYKKLLEIAPKFFTEPYFFQSYLTEKEAEPTFSRLRRSDTTGCTKFELECITSEYNKGIFIDIFPLFNVPESQEERQKQIEEIRYWWKLYKGYEVHRERTLNGFSKLSSDYDKYENMYLAQNPVLSFSEIKQKYVDACAQVQNRTSFVAPLSFRCNNPKTIWPRKWFDEQTMITFEDVMLPCPKAYFEMLEFQYGDWKNPVMNGAMHEMGIFDADVSYREKLRGGGGVYVREYFSSDYDELLWLLKEEYGSSVSKEDLEYHYSRYNKHILIAILKNRLVGCAFLSVDTDYIRGSHTSFVTYVAVHPDYRHMGIGFKLFREIERQSMAYACTVVELTSADFRTEAHQFYYALGFSRKKTTVFIKELDKLDE